MSVGAGQPGSPVAGGDDRCQELAIGVDFWEPAGEPLSPGRHVGSREDVLQGDRPFHPRLTARSSSHPSRFRNDSLRCRQLCGGGPSRAEGPNSGRIRTATGPRAATRSAAAAAPRRRGEFGENAKRGVQVVDGMGQRARRVSTVVGRSRPSGCRPPCGRRRRGPSRSSIRRDSAAAGPNWPSPR